jgi:hypothetical protein
MRERRDGEREREREGEGEGERRREREREMCLKVRAGSMPSGART